MTRALVMVLVVASLGARAGADADGDRLLAQVDQALDRAPAHVLEYRAVIGKPNSGERAATLAVQLKAGKWLIEFTAPEDMKGVKLLALSPTELYVYLPAFGKVRRIAAHTNDHTFMGLAYGLDNLFVRWGDGYTAVVASQSAAELALTLTPKAVDAAPYAKVVLTVDKKRMLPVRIETFDAAGARVKTETRARYTCQGDVCTAGEHKMIDHASGTTTTLTRQKWTPNAPISDDVFSKRALAPAP
jgi:hypothetical protein